MNRETAWNISVTVFDERSGKNIAVTTRTINSMIAANLVTDTDRDTLRRICVEAGLSIQKLVELKEFGG